MKISIMFSTAEFRGDHAADICVPVEYKDGETIAELLTRIKIGENQYARGEYVAIRLVDIEA